MRDSRDDDLLRAFKACARMAGYDIKKVSWADDLKNRTLTISVVGSSAGWVQETLDFEMEGATVLDPGEPAPLEVVTDGMGHVEKVISERTLQPGEKLQGVAIAAETDPSDLTETDETVSDTSDTNADQEAALLEGQRR